MHTDTIDYYNSNAQTFSSSTRDLDFHVVQDRFLAHLFPGAHILDLGCGAGRDTKYFLDKGYMVSAMDGSEELCKIASAYTGIEVQHRLFQEISEQNRYDGIWACASLLHVEARELQNILGKVGDALKENGILYLSFRYGAFEGERNGRYFLDMTEERFAAVLDNFQTLHIIWQGTSTDIRPDREEKWLNIILRKETPHASRT